MRRRKEYDRKEDEKTMKEEKKEKQQKKEDKEASFPQLQSRKSETGEKFLPPKLESSTKSLIELFKKLEEPSNSVKTQEFKNSGGKKSEPMRSTGTSPN